VIISCRKWVERFKFIVLFILLSCLVYQLMTWIGPWLNPLPKYREPAGDAVKVFGHNAYAGQGSLSERLKFFYWFGGE
jgi:hypothetical protein